MKVHRIKKHHKLFCNFVLIVYYVASLGRLNEESTEVNNWWTNSTSKKFARESKCMIDKYNNYTVFGKHVSYVEET